MGIGASSTSAPTSPPTSAPTSAPAPAPTPAPIPAVAAANGEASAVSSRKAVDGNDIRLRGEEEDHFDESVVGGGPKRKRSAAPAAGPRLSNSGIGKARCAYAAMSKVLFMPGGGGVEEEWVTTLEKLDHNVVLPTSVAEAGALIGENVLFAVIVCHLAATRDAECSKLLRRQMDRGVPVLVIIEAAEMEAGEQLISEERASDVFVALAGTPANLLGVRINSLAELHALRRQRISHNSSFRDRRTQSVIQLQSPGNSPRVTRAATVDFGRADGENEGVAAAWAGVEEAGGGNHGGGGSGGGGDDEGAETEDDQVSHLPSGTGFRMVASHSIGEARHTSRESVSGSVMSMRALETPLQQVSFLLSKAKLSKDLLTRINLLLEDMSSDPSQPKLDDNDSVLRDEETNNWLKLNFTQTVRERARVAQPLLSKPISLMFSDDDMERLKYKLSQWDFDVFREDETDLLQYALFMFVDFGVAERYNINLQTLRNFLGTLAASYRKENPYHNFRHAFDVLQMVYLLLVDADAAAFLNFQDIFVLLVGALAHDSEHPGRNNAFEVASRSDLALLYNDVSVLENHHVANIYRITKNDEMNIFQSLNDKEYTNVRQKLVSCILATDMSHHFSMVDMFGTRVQRLTESAFVEDTKEDREKQKKSKEDRRMLIRVITHAADISNVCRSTSLALRWAEAVQEEFFLQGDLERELELPISPFMDRQSPNPALLQINFIDFIVSGTFALLGRLLPRVGEVAVANIKTNRAHWAVVSARRQSQLALPLARVSSHAAKPPRITDDSGRAEEEDD